jgi:hypothetical protein
VSYKLIDKKIVLKYNRAKIMKRERETDRERERERERDRQTDR